MTYHLSNTVIGTTPLTLPEQTNHSVTNQLFLATIFFWEKTSPIHQNESFGLNSTPRLGKVWIKFSGRTYPNSFFERPGSLSVIKWAKIRGRTVTFDGTYDYPVLFWHNTIIMIIVQKTIYTYQLRQIALCCSPLFVVTAKMLSIPSESYFINPWM